MPSWGAAHGNIGNFLGPVVKAAYEDECSVEASDGKDFLMLQKTFFSAASEEVRPTSCTARQILYIAFSTDPVISACIRPNWTTRSPIAIHLIDLCHKP